MLKKKWFQIVIFCVLCVYRLFEPKTENLPIQQPSPTQLVQPSDGHAIFKIDHSTPTDIKPQSQSQTPPQSNVIQQQQIASQNQMFNPPPQILLPFSIQQPTMQIPQQVQVNLLSFTRCKKCTLSTCVCWFLQFLIESMRCTCHKIMFGKTI